MDTDGIANRVDDLDLDLATLPCRYCTCTFSVCIPLDAPGVQVSTCAVLYLPVEKEPREQPLKKFRYS